MNKGDTTIVFSEEGKILTKGIYKGQITMVSGDQYNAVIPNIKSEVSWFNVKLFKLELTRTVLIEKNIKAFLEQE